MSNPNNTFIGALCLNFVFRLFSKKKIQQREKNGKTVESLFCNFILLLMAPSKSVSLFVNKKITAP